MMFWIILKVALKSLLANKLRSVLAMLGIIIGRGATFTEADVDRMGRVAVLGPATAENLFGVEEPVGQAVKLNGVNFRVTGLLKSKGDQGWFNPDDQVVVPYTTAMKQILGVE